MVMTTNSNAKRVSLIIWGIYIALFTLYLTGYFFPGSRNWGFHFLGFLPIPWFFLYIVWMGLSVVLILAGHAEKLVGRLTTMMHRRPTVFLSRTIIGYLILAFSLRVEAPLLGDSFTFIKNYTDFYTGQSPLEPWHEPFAIYFFYLVLEIIGHATISEIMRTFFVVDLALGVIFLIITFQICRQIIGDPTDRMLVFLFLIFLPYINFFFGYVEIYALTLTLLSLYVYLGVLVVNKKLPFALFCLYGTIITFVNYLNGLLWIATGYLALLEFRQGGGKSVVRGFSLSALMALAVLGVVNFDLSRLIDQSPISHFLSLTTDISEYNKYSQAFTLFSVGHAVELANYILLMCPFAFMLIITSLACQPRLAIANPLNTFLGLITISYIGLLGVVKIQQGMANDWDVLASYFFC